MYLNFLLICNKYLWHAHCNFIFTSTGRINFAAFAVQTVTQIKEDNYVERQSAPLYS